MPIFIRTRIYPSPPAPDTVLNTQGAIGAASYKTSTSGSGTTAAEHKSELQGVPGNHRAQQDDETDYSAPLGGIELSGWT